MVPATINDNLVPNAIVEFHTAKDHGKPDAYAWAATVARIRYDVLRMAILTLSAKHPFAEGAEDVARKQCIDELIELQGDFDEEPDKPV